MPRTVRVVDIFLSSPSDVENERHFIVESAKAWNSVRGTESGVSLNILTWEEAVAPALGSRAQEVVNDQIGSTYDVYLGVLWTRIGTPTGKSESGTVEEFERALERAKKNGSPRIAAVFKKAAIDPTTIDPTQLQKVQEFKGRLGHIGAFYREFSDENSLRGILNLLFEQIAKDAADSEGKPKSEPSGPTSETSEIAKFDDQEEVGLIEIGESFERRAADLVGRLQDLTEEENRNTETLTECSRAISDLTSLGSFDQKSAKAIVHRSAKSLRSLSDHYDKSLDELNDIFIDIQRLVEADTRLRLEFDDPNEAAGGNITAMRELASTLKETIGSLEQLIASTRQLPPMSTELVKARNRLARARERFKEMIQSLLETVESSIEFFDNPKS